MAESRYLYGETNPVDAPVATAMGVDIGDLVALTTGTLTKASDEVWNTNEATTRAAFVTKFLGRSGQKKTAGSASIYGNGFDNLIRVDTTGVYEFDCVSGAYVQGERVGPAKQTGNALENQKVVVVTVTGESIGRVEKSGTGLTRVRVRLISKLMEVS